MLLLLDATTKSIEAVSDTGTADVVFVTAYADSSASTFTEGSGDGTVGTVDVTVVNAPGTSTRRVIKSINFYNTSAGARTVTLKYNNNGTKRTVVVFTLAAGENWSTDDLGGGGGISSLTVGSTPVTGTNGSVLYVNGSVLGEVATTGTGDIVRASSPTLTTPNLGTPSAATLTNATGLPLTTGVTGTLPVVNGGTGASSLALNNVLLGNSTSALQVVAPGTSGNVLTSNGTTWTSAAPTGGGSSLTNSNISPTSANVTATVNYRYFANISGLTANRDFILPTPAVGDTIQISIVTEDDTYALILKGDTGITINGGTAATEWSRLFIKNETVTFVANTTSNWQVLTDGRIPSTVRIAANSAQSISSSSSTQITLGSSIFDNASLGDTTNSRLKIRRAGKYMLAAALRFTGVAATISRMTAWIRQTDNGAIVQLAEIYASSTTSAPGVSIATIFEMEEGKTLDFFVFQNSGATQAPSSGSGFPHLEMTEVLT